MSIVCCNSCLLYLCHWDWCNCLTESAVLMINDLMLIRHYIRLSMAARRDWLLVPNVNTVCLFVCLFGLYLRIWTIDCVWPSLFMFDIRLSVSFVPYMLSYSIFWSQTSNKLTYLLIYTRETTDALRSSR